MEGTIQLIIGKIEELIRVAGGKVELFYPYVLRQQYVVAIKMFMCMVISLFIALIGIKWGLKEGKWNKWGEAEDLKTRIGVIFLSVGGSLLVIFTFAFVYDFLPRLLNPHFYAVKDLLELGKTLIK